MASFEEWDKFVRAPLIWLGFMDPRAAQAALSKTSDTDINAWNCVLQILATVFGARTFTAGQVVALAEQGQQASLAVDTHVPPDFVDRNQHAGALLESLLTLLPGKQQLNSGAVGSLLGNHKDSPVGGLCIRKKETRGAPGNWWWVERATA